jgi:predicted enzyme related to lactoylglutathione lyase
MLRGAHSEPQAFQGGPGWAFDVALERLLHQASWVGRGTSDGHLRQDEPMTNVRMDHVSIVVDDLEGAIAFFAELGLTMDGEGDVGGDWVDRINSLDHVDVRIAMMRTPDGHNALELTKFKTPTAMTGQPDPAPPNVLGLRSIMFEVDDVDDALARLQRRGGELIGTVERYENFYRLCYVRGPAGVIVALAEKLSGS